MTYQTADDIRRQRQARDDVDPQKYHALRVWLERKGHLKTRRPLRLSWILLAARTSTTTGVTFINQATKEHLIEALRNDGFRVREYNTRAAHAFDINDQGLEILPTP